MLIGYLLCLELQRAYLIYRSRTSWLRSAKMKLIGYKTIVCRSTHRKRKEKIVFTPALCRYLDDARYSLNILAGQRHVYSRPSGVSLESSQPLMTKCERSKHKVNRDASSVSHAFAMAIVAVLLSMQTSVIDEARKSVPTHVSNATKYSDNLFI